MPFLICEADLTGTGRFTTAISKLSIVSSIGLLEFKQRRERKTDWPSSWLPEGHMNLRSLDSVSVPAYLAQGYRYTG